VFDNEVALEVRLPDDSDVVDVEIDGAPASYTVETLGGRR
jgi:hypothetical protein